MGNGLKSDSSSTFMAIIFACFCVLTVGAIVVFVLWRSGVLCGAASNASEDGAKGSENAAAAAQRAAKKRKTCTSDEDETSDDLESASSCRSSSEEGSESESMPPRRRRSMSKAWPLWDKSGSCEEDQ